MTVSLLFIIGCNNNDDNSSTSSIVYKQEAVLCKYGQGIDGEYMHFRRDTAGLAVMACQDAFAAYTSYFQNTQGKLYCSPTPTCP